MYQFFRMSQKSRNSRINFFSKSFSMDLSVIIVHYRVPYFLEICLRSVRKALEGLDAEVIVVDNQSGDGGVDWLRPLFPEVNWILNLENEGFSRANNRALGYATGDFILFLNPDTIVPEDMVRKCLGFIGSVRPIGEVGGLGVRMIDGRGRFLRESRRGFPAPWVAFCKLSGLTALFPHSRRFARYYLGHLPSDKTSPVPVLSGACFFVTRSALDRVGPFDETFFMYAEDIDLSYRLETAGYSNYYFADVTIIHFKGESTPKDFRYIRQFYKAMIQFRRKHFRMSGLSQAAIEAGIWVRAAIGAVAVRAPRSARARRVWLTGDPEGIARLRSVMAVADERDADEIVFCIGDEFSFRSAIEALERKNAARSAAFFAAGCHAVVSSRSRDGKGDVWIL
jgi:N-acetylglucosaminyl-diphospho-decaprenol L-rhamnosyltransferase